MAKYVFCFNERTSSAWSPDQEYVKLYLKYQVEYLKIMKDHDGVLFVKDVLHTLGFDLRNFDIRTLAKHWKKKDVDIQIVNEMDSKEAYNPEPTHWLIIMNTD